MRGFSRADARELGHWRRAATAQAAQGGLGEVKLAGHGPARKGTQAERDFMENAYSRGEGRLGERSAQINVRSHFIRFLQAARAHMGAAPWQELPDGPLGWKQLFYGFSAVKASEDGVLLDCVSGSDGSDSDASGGDD